MARYLVAFVALVAITALASSQQAEAGLLAYGICQSGCNAVAASCYAAAGFTFGTVTAGVGIPAALVACNSALGFCMASCVAAGLAPTP
jgi:hypothetical protein